jgi:hypothetical protein
LWAAPWCNERTGREIIFLISQANLLDFKSRRRLWTGKFENVVNKTSPTRAIGFDTAFADQMLKVILEQLSKDGMILLPDNVVKIPPPKLGRY